MVHTPGGSETLNYTTLNAQVDLDGDGVGDASWSSYDTNNDGIIDAGPIKELSPGETFTILYSLNSQLGAHENTAKVTTFQGATDSDDANYYVLPENCVGVRTPGFWQNNNGGQFWDGIKGNEKNAGKVGFADGELLYAVDSNGDGVIDASDKAGLLIGDYNHNGLNNEGDAIFISYADARTLINANNGQMSNGTVKLGRDVVELPGREQHRSCFGHEQPEALPRRCDRLVPEIRR